MSWLGNQRPDVDIYTGEVVSRAWYDAINKLAAEADLTYAEVRMDPACADELNRIYEQILAKWLEKAQNEAP